MRDQFFIITAAFTVISFFATLQIIIWQFWKHDINKQRILENKDRQNDKGNDNTAVYTLYQTGQDNLISFKSTQWNITEYCALAYGAMIGILVLLEDRRIQRDWHILILAIMAIIVAEFSIYFIIELQCAITENRISINYWRKTYFPAPTPGLMNLSETEIKSNMRFFRDIKVPSLFIITIIIGLIIVEYILWSVGKGS